MSDFSVAIHAAVAAISDGVNAALNATGIDPTTKASVQMSMQSAVNTLGAAVQQETASAAAQLATDIGAGSTVASPPPAPVNLLATAENVVGQVVESTADAAITSVTGPLAPEAVQVANSLLNMLGGNLASAIDHLLGASQSSPAPAPKAPTSPQ